MADNDQLIVDHVPFANKMVGIFCRRYGIPKARIEEVRSKAYLALCQAARRYDPAKGASFKTFAFSYIRGLMLLTVRDYKRSLRFGPEQLRDYLDVSGVKVCYRFDENQEITADLTSSGEEEPERRIMAKDIRRLVDGLPERERELIRLHYLEDVGAKEVWSRMGISHTSFSNYKKRAIRLLREALDAGRAVQQIQVEASVSSEERPVERPVVVEERPKEIRIGRSDLLALRERLSREHAERLGQINAALSLLDSGLFGRPTVSRRARSRSRSSTRPASGALTKLIEEAVNSLPGEFTRRTAIVASEALGVKNVSNVDVYLYYRVKSGTLEKSGRGMFRKVEPLQTAA